MKPQPILQMWHQLHDLPGAEHREDVDVGTTGTGMKVHSNTAPSCAAIPPRNTRVLFVHQPPVLF